MIFTKQMIFYTLITIFLVMPFYGSSQEFKEDFFGGVGNSDAFNDVKNTDDGSIAFGYTTSPADHYQFFLVKFDEAGNETWSQTYGTAVNAVGEKILVLADGYLLAGTTEPVNQIGAEDIYLIKIDLDGNILWEQTYGGSGNDVLGDIIVDNDGNFAMAGGSVVNEIAGEEMFLTLINEDGMELWTQYYGSTETADKATCLIADSNGNYLLGGTFAARGTVLSVGANTQAINWMLMPTGAPTDFIFVEDIAYFPNGTDFLVVGSSNLGEPIAAKLLPDGNITAFEVYEDIFSSTGYLSSVTLRDGVFNVMAIERFFDRKVVRLDLNLLNLGSFEIDITIRINALEITLNGDLIVVGSVDNLNRDAFVTSYNLQGFNLWQQTLGQLEETNSQIGFAIEATLDSGFVFTGSRNIYKLNKELEVEWITEFNEISNPWSLVQSPDLNYYVLKSVSNFGQDDRVLQKLDINGVQIWEINLSDVNFVYPLFGKVLNLADGNLLTLYSEFTDNQGEISILKKISPSGDILWSKSLSLKNQTRGYSVIETSDNNFVVCGVGRDPGENYQGFLAKVDQDGNLIWDRNHEFEGNFNRSFTRLYEAENGDLVMIGTDFDEVFFPVLFRADANGNELNRKYFGGDYTTHRGYDLTPISVEGNNQIIFTSTSYSVLNNDPLSINTSRRARFTTVDQNFEVVSEQSFGAGVVPVLYDMAVSLDGKIAAVGAATNGSSSKAFLVTSGSEGVGTNTVDLSANNVISVFPNPSNGMINIKLDHTKEGILDLRVLNSQGQMLWEGQERKDSDAFVKTLNFSFLPKGQYFISISQDGQTWSKQWLKTEN